MQGGDISNEVSPRLLIVFEGLLGILPDSKARAAESVARKARRWKRAVKTYEINEPMARAIWDVTWRYHQSVDVVTYLGDEFADALRDRLDEESLPIGHVMATEHHLLARRLAYAPDIAAVYHANPEHRFTYGSKGYLISPQTPQLLGRF